MSRINIFARHSPTGYRVHLELDIPLSPETEKPQLSLINAALDFLAVNDFEPDAGPAARPGKTEPTEVGPECEHGSREYRESKAGADKPWKAWFCPLGSEREGEKCKPLWVKAKDDWKSA